MRTLCAVLATVVAASAATPIPSADFSRGDLKVSSNHRFLVHADGTPFFYLGDTAWELFHRATREDAERYLENRRAKRFTVIQAVALAELDGLDTPNLYGEKPLIDHDPTRPNEAYFRHVDWIVKRAEEKGLYIGFLPTWGNKVVKGSWEKTAQIIFNPENARVYGRWIGSRYRNAPNIIWILGGDRNPDGVVPIWREMARGIRESDRRHLITFHPNGASSSSKELHNEDWLDFNMIQSGHVEKDLPNFEYVAHDYALVPVKPTIDGENRYEDHPVNWQPKEKGWFDDYDVRQASYWAVFAGAFGHTYGTHPVWQFFGPGHEPVAYARHTWMEAADFPGAARLHLLRELMESRPFLSRVPDQSMLIGNPEKGLDHAQATRGDGYAFVYIPSGKPVHVHLGAVTGARLNAQWFDPRTGAVKAIGVIENKGQHEFTPPGEPVRGNDWVLVLDDAGRKFPPPGKGQAMGMDR